MHLKSFFALAILLATAAAVDILPLASSFDDYVPPASIEIAGLTLETHHLRPNPNDMQEWNDYAFVINERDRNQDILRQSLCEVSEVAGMTDEGDETICYYSPGLEETLGSLSAEDVEDIQMEYQGIIEDFPEMPSSDGDFEDQEREEDMMSLLRQTVTLRFGPVTGKFDFVVNIVGEDGTLLGAIDIKFDDWSCNEPAQDDPSQAQYCIWNPSNESDRVIDLPGPQPERY